MAKMAIPILPGPPAFSFSSRRFFGWSSAKPEVVMRRTLAAGGVAPATAPLRFGNDGAVAPEVPDPHGRQALPPARSRDAAVARSGKTASAASKQLPAVSWEGTTQQQRPAAFAARRPRSESSI